MLRSWDPNALAEEIVRMYTDNKLDKNEILKIILPKVEDLKLFKGFLKRIIRHRELEKTCNITWS